MEREEDLFEKEESHIYRDSEAFRPTAKSSIGSFRPFRVRGPRASKVKLSGALNKESNLSETRRSLL